MKLFFYITILILTSCQTEEKPPGMHDKKLIKKVSYYSNGKINEVKHYWQDSILHGEYITYFEDGTIDRKGFFNRNKMTGWWSFYFNNGVLREKAQYVNGKMNGTDSLFYDNEQLRETGIYIEGEEEGPWIYFHKNGQKQHECIFINHMKQLNSNTWDSSGNLVPKIVL